MEDQYTGIQVLFCASFPLIMHDLRDGMSSRTPNTDSDLRYGRMVLYFSFIMTNNAHALHPNMIVSSQPLQNTYDDSAKRSRYVSPSDVFLEWHLGVALCLLCDLPQRFWWMSSSGHRLP